jgi:transcriptional regulator with XRE-family HTH domain
MDKHLWRVRIEEAIARDGRSPRELSLAAGLSHGYLHGILRNAKEPTLDRFMRLCEVLDMSSAWLLFGTEASLDLRDLLDLRERNPELPDRIAELLRGPSQTGPK